MSPKSENSGAPDNRTGRTNSIGNAALLGAVSTAATVGFSIARSKVTALVLGPTGVGVTAEILQLVTLAMAPVVMFSGPVLVSKLAAAQARGDTAAINRLQDTAWTLSGLTALVAAIAAVVSGLFLLPAPWGPSAWVLTALASAGALVGVLINIPTQSLVVFGKLRVLMLLGIGTACLQTLLVIAATTMLGLKGQFLALALGPLLGLLLATFTSARHIPTLRWRRRWLLDRSFLQDALRFGGTALASALGLQVALFVLRTALEAKGGPALNGQFQAAWSIGSVYFGFVLGGIGTFAFPRYAAAQTVDELATEVRNASRFVLRVAPPVILGMVALRAPLVHLLYSEKFDEAIPLMGLMMVGDLARAMVWVQHGPLLYRGRLRAYLAVEVFGVICIGAGGAVLVPSMGLVGIGYAYTGASLLSMLTSAWALRLSTGVWTGWGPLALAFGGTGLLAVAAGVGSSTIAGRIGVLSVAFVWALVSGLIGDIAHRVAALTLRLRQQ